MGRKTGITVGGYHPRIHKMQWVMEQRAFLREQEDLLMSKTKTSINYWKQRACIALDLLQSIDLNGWEAWYDNDQNVPEIIKSEELAKLVEARIIELQGPTTFPTSTLHRNIFIWHDSKGYFVYSKEIGKETLYANEFSTEADAKKFIMSLPAKNMGYGVILDIIPAPALSEVRAEVE